MDDNSGVALPSKRRRLSVKTAHVGIRILDVFEEFAIDYNLNAHILIWYGQKYIVHWKVNWFISYLDKRYQTCKVNNVWSSRKLIERGVSQGSNLGHPQFLLYVNDLPNCLDQAEFSVFTDDINVSTATESVEKLETLLNFKLDNIYRWLVANRLTLNVSKTEYMIIGSRHNLDNINKDPAIKVGSDL